MSDPRSLAEFWDLLPVAQGTVWRDKRNDELAGTGDGGALAIELATPLWSADVVLDFSEWPEARELAARVRSLNGPMQSFLMPNPIAQFPAYDPDGAILGAAEVEIETVGADNASLAFNGLPDGYRLDWGDLGEVVYSSNPQRRYVFEIRGSVEANSEGKTGLVAVGPHIWPGITEGQAVNFKRPAPRMFMVPGSLREGAIRAGIVDGMSFSALQRP